MSPSPQPQFGREMHTRIPPRVQQIMAKKLERSVPGYMKQYVGPYMQQNVVHPAIGGPPGGGFATPSGPATVSLPPTLHANTGESWRQSHFQPTNAAAPETAPAQAAGQPSPANPAEPYAFITKPAVAKRSSFRLPGTSSLALRIAYIAGGLLVLVIIFSIVKGLLGGSSGLTSFLPVAQDQQEMVHLITNAAQQQGLSTNTQNFVATAQLSLASHRSSLLQYLAKNNYKPQTKELGLRISASLDAQLTTAVANTTFDQTFQAAMKDQLGIYLNDLKHTYNQTTGTNGRALLSDDYNQAQLLLTQLQAPGQ